MSENILIIRMADKGDVLSVGLPAVRFFQKKYPAAKVSVLTYGDCAQFFNLGTPDVNVISLEQNTWPENIISAMEVFLGLAEQIIGEGFTKIVNLDTAFMPCFLARFLKDAGQPVEGNLLSLSVDELITGLQQESLAPELVNNPESYINSTWFGFSQWYSRWWETDDLPDRGYCEFYLSRCCGYSSITLDMSLPFKEIKTRTPYVALYLGAVASSVIDTNALIALLDKNSVPYKVITDDESVDDGLSIIGNAAFLVTTPSAFQWFAVATDTPTLLISGQFDPRLTMPDFATNANEQVDAAVLVKDIVGLLENVE